MFNKKNENSKPNFISPHGGYHNLKSCQMAAIIYDATAVFCDLFVNKRSRTHDQMVQAVRSGKTVQDIFVTCQEGDYGY